MKDIVFALLCFLPLILLMGSVGKTHKQSGVIVIAAWVAWMAAAAFVVSGVAVYLSYRTAQKQRQKNKTKPSQFDTTLADEGVSCSRIGGSPHMYGNLVEVWDKSSAEIKKKAGGK